MKKLLLLLPFGLLITACSNDFDVTAPWKEIPVVYGILSPQDTAHYIRVEKAFLDPEKSALAIAQIADSLYYPENAIAVFLERTDNQSRIQLQRVNGALEGYPRDPGVFAGQPNWLYKAKSTGSFSILGGKTYRLVIERSDNRDDITAETTLPKDFVVTQPNLSTQVPVITFEKTSPGTPIQWLTDINGYFFNVTFRIRYFEKNLNGTIASTHELVWEQATNIIRDDMLSGNGVYKVTENIPKNSFYNFLAKNMDRPGPNLYREFQSIDLIIDGGGKEIKEYLDTYEVNGNITGAETFPNYTNISEGYGIFTSKNRTVVEGIKITSPTVDSMNVSSITDTLGFKY